MTRERRSDPAKEFLMQAATGMQCHYKIINTITNDFIFTDNHSVANGYIRMKPLYKVYMREELYSWREI